MCDYSLQSLESRPAKVGDKLTVKDFGTGTRGFCESGDPESKVAVCVLPGTEIGFSAEIHSRPDNHWLFTSPANGLGHDVAIFRQIEKDNKHTHHDALELPSGKVITLNMLTEGQEATVLQLPAAPKNEAEAKEQTRLEVVA